MPQPQHENDHDLEKARRKNAERNAALIGHQEEGVFWHVCTEEGCNTSVEFDDEPKCFTHSPDEGSSLWGYSARAESEKERIE